MSPALNNSCSVGSDIGAFQANTGVERRKLTPNLCSADPCRLEFVLPAYPSTPAETSPWSPVIITSGLSTSNSLQRAINLDVSKVVPTSADSDYSIASDIVDFTIASPNDWGSMAVPCTVSPCAFAGFIFTSTALTMTDSKAEYILTKPVTSPVILAADTTDINAVTMTLPAQWTSVYSGYTKYFLQAYTGNPTQKVDSLRPMNF